MLTWRSIEIGHADPTAMRQLARGRYLTDRIMSYDGRFAAKGHAHPPCREQGGLEGWRAEPIVRALTSASGLMERVYAQAALPADARPASRLRYLRFSQGFIPGCFRT